MIHRVHVIAVFVGFVGASWTACNSKRLAHSGEDPVYPLRGLHAAVPCAGCHGADSFDAAPNLCVQCHNEDRPSPDHFPEQGCIDCHTEEGWDQVEPTQPVDEPPPFEHPEVPETQLCWDCHEAERKGLDHYADPLVKFAPDPVGSSDCGGCHTTTAWDNNAIIHPVRLPHGVEIGPEECAPRPEEEWQTGCVGCHPNGTDTFVCFACHNEDEAPGEFVHANGQGEPTWEESQCLSCHIDAEADNCVEPAGAGG